MPVIPTSANGLLLQRLRALSQVTDVPIGTLNKVAVFVRQADAEIMYLNGMTMRQIAQAMDVSHTTIENWLYAQRKFRKESENEQP